MREQRDAMHEQTPANRSPTSRKPRELLEHLRDSRCRIGRAPYGSMTWKAIASSSDDGQPDDRNAPADDHADHQ